MGRSANVSSPWNGDVIGRRKDCDGCPYLIAGEMAHRLLMHIRLPRVNRGLIYAQGVELCGWGVAVKQLVVPGTNRRCDKRKTDSSAINDWLRWAEEARG